MSGESLMRTVVSAFEKSDLGPLLNALHDDVVWKSASRHAGGPFSFEGDYRNRAGVIELLSNIAKDYTFHHMTPKDITAKGDVVWGLFDVGLRYDPKGKTDQPRFVELEIALRWHLKDGKIIEHQAFFDTAWLATRQGAHLKPQANRAAHRPVAWTARICYRGPGNWVKPRAAWQEPRHAQTGRNRDGAWPSG